MSSNGFSKYFSKFSKSWPAFRTRSYVFEEQRVCELGQTKNCFIIRITVTLTRRASVNNGERVIYEFGGFRLDPEHRILLRDGDPVTIWPKVFDTLVFLLQSGGRLVEKDELMQALWPESFVEESNLTQNIFVLRKILGDDRNGHGFIQTVPRRGYKFIAPVREEGLSATESDLPASYWRVRSPFRGLQVFETEDAWLFFGRE